MAKSCRNDVQRRLLAPGINLLLPPVASRVRGQPLADAPNYWTPPSDAAGAAAKPWAEERCSQGREARRKAPASALSSRSPLAAGAAMPSDRLFKAQASGHCHDHQQPRNDDGQENATHWPEMLAFANRSYGVA